MKKLFSLVLALAMILNLTAISTVTVFAAGDAVIRGEQYSYDLTFNKGEVFNVNIILDNEASINGMEFRIKYDPNVIKAVSYNDTDIDGYITYVDNYKNRQKAVANGLYNSQLNQVPSKSSSASKTIYEGKADGVKTAAELGIIKIALMVGGIPVRTVNPQSGILMTIPFEMVGEGSTTIEIDKGNSSGSGSIFTSKDSSTTINTSVDPIYVNLKGTSSQTTTKKQTQTTTKKQTQTTTKKQTQTTTKKQTQTTTKSENVTETTTSKENVTETTTSKENVTETTTSKENATETTTKSSSDSDMDDDVVTESTTDVGYDGSEKGENETDKSKENNSDEGNGNDIGNFDDSNLYFKDLGRVPWAANAIEELYDKKIVSGVGEHSFNPTANVKRADFLMMLLSALDINGEATTNFNDVDSSKYYANAVGLAKEKGIANGYNGNFNPEAYITRQDMMVLASLALESLEDADLSSLDKFDDKDLISDYAKSPIAKMTNASIVSGTGNNIEPKYNTTRAQAAVIIYNIYNQAN